MDDFTISVVSNIGLFSFLALSAYLLLLTGEISFGQQAYFALRRLWRGHRHGDVGLAAGAGHRVGGGDRNGRRGAGRAAHRAPARALFLDRHARLCRDGAPRLP
jgi:hypothetical protein